MTSVPPSQGYSQDSPYDCLQFYALSVPWSFLADSVPGVVDGGSGRLPATASQGSVGFAMQLPLPGRTKLSEEKLTFWLTKPVFLLPQSVLRHQCNLLYKVGQCSEEQFLQLKKHGLS